MRKVVDKSYLRFKELDCYLKGDKNNKVVLCDYLMIESYRGEPLVNIQNSMRILRHYPDQIVILKSTEFISKMKGKRKGLQKRMIDEKTTSRLPKFFKNLDKAYAGDIQAKRSLEEKGIEAGKAYQEVLKDIENSRRAMMSVTSMYGQTKEYDSKVFMDNVLLLTEALFSKHSDKYPDIDKLLESDYLHNMFTFRFSLCVHLLIYQWGYERGLETVNQNKLKNDMVDMIYVAYASYFDGFLTRDNKARYIFEIAVKILRRIDNSQFSEK